MEEPNGMPEVLEDYREEGRAEDTVGPSDREGQKQSFREPKRSIPVEIPSGISNFSVQRPEHNSLLEQHRSKKFQEAYDTVTKTIGRCLIISNKTFDDAMYGERTGTEVDGKNVYNLFEQLGYQMIDRREQTAEQIMNECRAFIQDPDFAKFSSCVLVILSHGHEGYIVGKDGKSVAERDIVALFNDSSCMLKDKPKLIIIQACRVQLTADKKKPKVSYRNPIHHDSADTGAGEESSPEREAEDPGQVFETIERLRDYNYGDFKNLNQEIPPDNADILIAHSTLPGYLSWRNRNQGSWFIQAIVEVFSAKCNDEHVADMLVMVNNVVSRAFGQGKAAQMPQPINHLRKKFYFFSNNAQRSVQAPSGNSPASGLVDFSAVS